MIDYFQALERLKSGKTLVVKKPYLINNDTVALEAGRGRGSIKKSRKTFHLLIEEIIKAAAERADKQSASPFDKAKAQLEKYKIKNKELEQKYQDSIGRELSLIKQVHELQIEVINLKK